MKTLRLLSFVAGFAFLFSGCSGPEGPQGPAGNDGLNGSNGVANISIGQLPTFNSWTSVASYFQATYTDGAINDPTNLTVQVFFLSKWL